MDLRVLCPVVENQDGGDSNYDDFYATNDGLEIEKKQSKKCTAADYDANANRPFSSFNTAEELSFSGNNNNNNNNSSLNVLAHTSFVAPTPLFNNAVAAAHPQTKQSALATAASLGAMLVVGSPDGVNVQLVKVASSAGQASTMVKDQATNTNAKSVEVVIGDLNELFSSLLTARASSYASRPLLIKNQRQSHSNNSQQHIDDDTNSSNNNNNNNNGSSVMDCFRVSLNGVDVLLPSRTAYSDAIPTPSAPSSRVYWGVATVVVGDSHHENEEEKEKWNRKQAKAAAAVVGETEIVSHESIVARIRIFITRYTVGHENCEIACVDHVTMVTSRSDEKTTVPTCSQNNAFSLDGKILTHTTKTITRVVSFNSCPLVSDFPSSSALSGSSTDNSGTTAASASTAAGAGDALSNNSGGGLLSVQQLLSIKSRFNGSSSSGKTEGRVLSREPLSVARGVDVPLTSPSEILKGTTNNNNNSNNMVGRSGGVFFKVTDLPSVDGRYHIALSVTKDESPPENDDDHEIDDNNQRGREGAHNNTTNSYSSSSSYICAVAIGTTIIAAGEGSNSTGGGKSSSAAVGQPADAFLAALGLGGGDAAKKTATAGGGDSIGFGSRKQRERQKVELDTKKKNGDGAEDSSSTASKYFELAIVTGVCYFNKISDNVPQPQMSLYNSYYNSASVGLSVGSAPSTFARLVVPISSLNPSMGGIGGGGECFERGLCGVSAVSRIAEAGRCVVNACGAAGTIYGGTTMAAGVQGRGLLAMAMPAIVTPNWKLTCTTPMRVGASSNLYAFDVLAAVADLPPHSPKCSANGGGGSDKNNAIPISKGLAAPGVIGRIAVTFNRQSHLTLKKAMRYLLEPTARKSSFNASLASGGGERRLEECLGEALPIGGETKNNKTAADMNGGNVIDSLLSATLTCPMDAAEKVPHTCSFDHISYMQEENAPHYFGAIFGNAASASFSSLASAGTSSALGLTTASGASTVAKSFFSNPLNGVTPTATGAGGGPFSSATMTSDVAGYVALYGEENARVNVTRRRKREAMLCSREEEANKIKSSYSVSGVVDHFEAAPSPFSSDVGGRRIVFSPDNQLASEPLLAAIPIPLLPYTVSTSSSSAPNAMSINSSTPPPSLILLVLPTALLVVDPRFSSGRCVIAALRSPLPTIRDGFGNLAFVSSLSERDGAAVLLSMGGDTKNTIGGIVSSKIMTAWDKLTSTSGSSGVGNNSNAFSHVPRNSGAAQSSSARTNTTVVLGTIVASGGSSSSSTPSPVLNVENATLVHFILAIDPSPEVAGTVAVTRFEIAGATHNGLLEVDEVGMSSPKSEQSSFPQLNGDDDQSLTAEENENKKTQQLATNPKTTAKTTTLFTAVTHVPTTPALARALDLAMGSSSSVPSSSSASASASKLNRSAEPTMAFIATASSDGLVRLTDVVSSMPTTMTTANSNTTSTRSPSSNAASPQLVHKQRAEHAHTNVGIIIGYFDELLNVANDDDNNERNGVESPAYAKKKSSQKKGTRWSSRCGHWDVRGEVLTQIFVSVDSAPTERVSNGGGGGGGGGTVKGAGAGGAIAATIICCLGFKSGLVKIFETKLFDPLSLPSLSSWGAAASAPRTLSMTTVTSTPALKYERYLHNGPVTSFFNVDQIERNWHLASLHKAHQGGSVGSSGRNGITTGGGGGGFFSSGFTSPTVMSPNSASPTTTASSPSPSATSTPPPANTQSNPDRGTFPTATTTTAASSTTAQQQGNNTSNNTTLSLTDSFLASLEFRIVSASASGGTICLHRKADFHRYAILHGSLSSSASAAADPLTGAFFDAESEYALLTTASGKGYLWQVVTGVLERIYRTPRDFINAIDVSANLLALVPSVAAGETIKGKEKSAVGSGSSSSSVFTKTTNTSNTGDAALSLLPISAYNDPLTGQNVLSLSTVRFTDMLRKEIHANNNKSHTHTNTQTPVGFSPTVLRGAHALLQSLARLYQRVLNVVAVVEEGKNTTPAFGSPSRVGWWSSSSVKGKEGPSCSESFEKDLHALGSYFGISLEAIMDQERRRFFNGVGGGRGGKKERNNNNNGGDEQSLPSESASIATEVLFAITALRTIVNTNQATASGLIRALNTANPHTHSNSNGDTQSRGSSSLFYASDTADAYNNGGGGDGGLDRIDAVASRLLIVMMTRLPWAVPRGYHHSNEEGGDSALQDNYNCHLAQSRNVIAVIREMVPLLIIASSSSSSSASSPTTSPSQRLPPPLLSGGSSLSTPFSPSASLLAAGAEAVIASALSHISEGPWCPHCQSNNNKSKSNNNGHSSLSPLAVVDKDHLLFEVFSAMILDPSEAKPPIAYTPNVVINGYNKYNNAQQSTDVNNSSSSSGAGGVGSNNRGEKSSSSSSAARTPMSISPPPQVITMSAAAGGVLVGAAPSHYSGTTPSYGGGDSANVTTFGGPSGNDGSGVTPTFLDQSAYLFLLCTIVCTLLNPRSEKQLKIVSDLALDLEVKIPPYLRLAVVGGFGYAFSSSSSGGVPAAAASAQTSSSLGISQRPLSPIPSISGNLFDCASGIAPSAAGSIAILSTVLRLVSSRWATIRRKLKDPDNVLKQILVSGVLRDVTVPTVRSAAIASLATAFIHQLRCCGPSVEDELRAGCLEGDKNASSATASTALWEMLKTWFNTSTSSFHPDYVWRGGTESSSSGANNNNNINNNINNNSVSSPTSAAHNINSKESSETHRYMLIHILARVIQMSPSDTLLNDGMLKILPLVFIAIDPHSPSRAEREACLPAVASLLRVAVKHLPNVAFQQKFQRIVVGTNSGAVVVYDVKSTDEIARFQAFEPSASSVVAATAKKSTLSTPMSSKTKRGPSNKPGAATVPFSEVNPPPPHAVAAVAYSNLHHDIAILSWDLSSLRVFHASGSGTFFLIPSNHTNFKLKREVMITIPPPQSEEGSLLRPPLAAHEVAARCSLVWLSPQCVEVTSPSHDKLQATV